MDINHFLKNSKFLKRLAGLSYPLIPCLMATWLYAPALFFGKTQIHGDSIFHSISVMEFNRKMLHDGISPLWTNLLFGGHPYFAEGQGGFFNPLNFSVALFFDPVAGQNIYHWLSMLIGILGMYLLCRHFRCSREASTFGVLAVIFSAYWLHCHHNVTISGALCWIPWTFLCFERWVAVPSGKSGIWLALSVSLLIFSGYPQAFHGAIIYMAVSLIPTLFSGYIGSQENNSLKRYLLTGLTAIVVCIGLSAVQWLPLLELVTWSQRSGGTCMLFSAPASYYLRGFLATFSNGTDLQTYYLSSTGSLLVCYLASLSLALKPNHRMVGHIAASVFLLILGLEYVTPIFGYLLKYQLAPGLKYFRTVHLYLGIAIIGLGLLGCFAIDRIQRWAKRLESTRKDRLIFFVVGTVLFFVWVGILLLYKFNEVPKITYVLFAVAYITLMLSIWMNKPSWFGHVALMLIVFEIMILRMSPFPFYDIKPIEKPRIVQRIQDNVLNKEYKFMNLSMIGLVGFTPPWDPNLEAAIHDVLNRALASANVLWDIPSIEGDLALPLARRMLIQPKMEAEISGADPALPGARLIDYLSIRYISVDVIPKTPRLKPLVIDGVAFLENQYARPRVQTFTRYEMADSAEDALNRLKSSNGPALILEAPIDKFTGLNHLPASTAVNNAKAVNILSAKLINDQYRFEVKAAQPSWLFIADANYPGWQAKIDGQATPVYGAQVLGKAVFVPSGTHQITVEFKPRSFMIGMFLSIFTLLVLLMVGIRNIYPNPANIFGFRKSLEVHE